MLFLLALLILLIFNWFCGTIFLGDLNLMDADQIRDMNTNSAYGKDTVIQGFLREIAAQLAELNQQLKIMTFVGTKP